MDDDTKNRLAGIANDLDLPVDPEFDLADPAEPSVHHLRTSHGGTGARLRPGVLGAIAAGGALGAPARIEVGRIVATAPNGYPWATFAVNLIGSFVLGLAVVVILGRLQSTKYIRPFLASGVCGAFTTFSALVVEFDLLVRAHRLATAVVYLVATVSLGFVAVVAGIVVARRYVRARARV
jgi:CrcB protein